MHDCIVTARELSSKNGRPWYKREQTQIMKGLFTSLFTAIPATQDMVYLSNTQELLPLTRMG